MRHYELTDHAVAEHIVARYGQALDIDHLERTADRRFRAIREDGTNVVINVQVVGPNNAGPYRHWLAMAKPAWGRVFGEKPAGWEHYILMVGLLPDGSTIWWSAMYDEAKVAALGLEPDYPRSGYGRLAPSLVKSALVVAPMDEVQTSLWDEPATPACDHGGGARYVTEAEGGPGWQCVQCGHPFAPVITDQMDAVI